MTEIEKGRWELPDAEVAEMLHRLEGMENIMIVLRSGGATHERIGAVGEVSRVGDMIAIGGPVHTARIDPGAASRIVFDTSLVIAGGSYPALEFQDEDGTELFKAIAMGGAPAFVAAFGAEARVALEPKERMMPSMGGDADEITSDPAFILLNRLREEGDPVEIRHRLAGREQSWQGTIETVRPGMGFSNVTTDDFHLHVKAGAVSEWRETPAGWLALAPDGSEIGLVVARMTKAAA
ncbi:hypothetical protein [Tropicimonas sp. IMCC34011]|uniref:hypothetical protein n=1 Tax=Tropicimonas sp. IMCC34011 TaxID=2248759 RepID=UPI000E2757DE|nr:hypothetical protein [Tropicimonas sp. IMCC34011]